MNILARLTISTKILILLLMLGAVTLAVALAGSRSLSNADSANTVMVVEAKAPVAIARASRNATEMSYAAHRALIYSDDTREAKEAQDAEQKAYGDGSERLRQALAALPRLKAELSQVSIEFERLHGLMQRAIRLSLAGDSNAARAVLVEADPIAVALSKQMSDLNDTASASFDATATTLTATAQSQIYWLLVVGIAGIVVSIGTSLLVSRFGITGPLARLNSAMQALAAGNNRAEIGGTDRGDEVGAMARVVLVFRDTAIAKDAADASKANADAEVRMVVETLGGALSDLSNRDLTGRVTADFPGAYGVLKDNFNDAIDNVRATIRQVSDGAANIRTGSDEIAQASEDLARRTESNAASLEETSAALVQIEGRLKATATASMSTVARADQAMATVNSGRTIADTAMQAMGRVSGSAKGIDDVIEGLDKIAFQTRVLAMNAAVEAGRAGDAGRGFAVVADLVSALAMRAEEEAKRARDQLSITQSEIFTAVDAVGKVDTALAAISADVGEVNHLLAGMASDNIAQSSAITEITAAVATMDHATQQNAAMVEETSAAARNLNAEVGHLANAAAQFATGATGHQPVAARPIKAASVSKMIAPPVRRPSIKPVPALANGHALGKADSSDWTDF